MKDEMVSRPQLLLTDEELNKAWDDVFDIPMNFDHYPTAEEIFTIRLRAVAKAQLAKVRTYYI